MGNLFMKPLSLWAMRPSDPRGYVNG
jgi:hypothetical protein